MKLNLKKTSLGIEFGSTRIKAVLIDDEFKVIANGSYNWENQLVNGFWTYSKKEIIFGLQTCFKDLKVNFETKYQEKLTTIGSIGISGMMHGYIALDEQDNLLVPFRTWRNNNTEKLAEELTQKLNYQIPARWSIAHLYYAIIKKEEHVSKINFQTTIAGYVHYLLTNEKVVGLNEASGMFPIDLETLSFDQDRVDIFNQIIKDNNLNFKLENIFPKPLKPGIKAGLLTKDGSQLLDISNELETNIPFVAPEGDAGTGMIATNSIKKNTGNISAGTSIFGMVVLDKPLINIYPEIDLVTTPDGNLVAMVHANNCTSDINSWINLFKEVINTMGFEVSPDMLYEKMFLKSLEGQLDAGNMLSYNYISGENITKIDKGIPIFLRTSESNFNLANFMRLQIYSSFATLKIGMNILTTKERIKINSIVAHGGIFKTKGVAQKFLASALNVLVSVNDTANEGGPFGMALLAMYLFNNHLSLPKYLDLVFKDNEIITIKPILQEVEGYNKFFENYIKGLKIVSEASKII